MIKLKTILIEINDDIVNIPLKKLYSVETPDLKKVKLYQDAMKDGKIFPPLEVEPMEKGMFYVIDGNHRLQAAWNLKIDSLPCKIISNYD